jgi:hypothetical protein
MRSAARTADSISPVSGASFCTSFDQPERELQQQHEKNDAAMDVGWAVRVGVRTDVGVRADNSACSSAAASITTAIRAGDERDGGWQRSDVHDDVRVAGRWI